MSCAPNILNLQPEQTSTSSPAWSATSVIHPLTWLFIAHWLHAPRGFPSFAGSSQEKHWPSWTAGATENTGRGCSGCLLTTGLDGSTSSRVFFTLVGLGLGSSFSFLILDIHEFISENNWLYCFSSFSTPTTLSPDFKAPFNQKHLHPSWRTYQVNTRPAEGVSHDVDDMTVWVFG